MESHKTITTHSYILAALTFEYVKSRGPPDSNWDARLRHANFEWSPGTPTLELPGSEVSKVLGEQPMEHARFLDSRTTPNRNHDGDTHILTKR